MSSLLSELASIVSELADAAALSDPRPALRRRPPVVVRGEGAGAPAAPFSKGFLSQSLLAAAIEPNEAFDVAREIEGQLVDRGVTEIQRRDLRRLACETLDRRFGPRVAVRYLVWRRFQDPDKPVILLLGGAAGVGKSSLAQEVAHRLGVPRVVSTDAIRQVMRIMLSQELVPAIELAIARFRDLVALSDQADSLAEQLETRKIVDRAKGRLMDAHGMNEQDAFRFLQTTAMGSRASMRDVATRVIDGDLTPDVD